MRFYWENFIDAAAASILSYSSQAANLPAENLRNASRTKTWQTTGALNTEYVVFDLGSARAVDSVILLDYDSTVATAYIEANTSNSFGAPAFSSALAAGVTTFGAAQTYRYWRARFSDAAPIPAFNLGRLYLGSYYEPTDPPDWNGYIPGAQDLSLKTRGPYGQTFGDARPQYRQTRFSWTQIPNAQKVTMKAATARLGTLTPFFVVADAAVTYGDEVGEPVYVTLRDTPDFPHAGYSDESKWNTRWDLDEEL